MLQFHVRTSVYMCACVPVRACVRACLWCESMCGQYMIQPAVFLFINRCSMAGIPGQFCPRWSRLNSTDCTFAPRKALNHSIERMNLLLKRHAVAIGIECQVFHTQDFEVDFLSCDSDATTCWVEVYFTSRHHVSQDGKSFHTYIYVLHVAARVY